MYFSASTGYRVRVLLVFCCVVGYCLTTKVIAERPNILWISAEDIGPHLGCFGDPHAITPNIDQLANEGVRFTHAFTTAGVCAPCRSGIITGMYQSTLGTHHMRCKARLPDFIQPFPVYLREAGYYCTNNSKTDYQFVPPENTWDESSGKAHWRNRKDRSQPFFAVFNFGGCHESGIAKDDKYREVTSILKPNQRQVASKLTTYPPYYPDTAAARDDWKRNYELITALDYWAADLIQQLKDDGLYEDTIVFFWSDHGVGLPRAKRWLYDSGTHIPLVVRIPQKYRSGNQGRPGSVSNRLVSSIDFGPTVLNLAGINCPDHVQGQPFLGDDLPEPRRYVFGARDRMDERYDIIRSVRNHRYRYIRNYEPLKTYYQYMNTPEKGRLMREIRRVESEGSAAAGVAQFLAPTKPPEELYDLENDPHEMENLVDSSAHQSVLNELREVHLGWVRESKDLGLIPEPILNEREQELGSQYAILRQPGGDQLSARVGRIADLASQGISALPELLVALDDPDDVIRYWGATGIGNLGEEGVGERRDELLMKIEGLLQDPSATVRVSAARATERLGDAQRAIPVLIDALQSDQQWVRLHAAIVLDEMDEAARPACHALHEALEDQPNKYIVRVANRALNQLEGTDRAVK